MSWSLWIRQSHRWLSIVFTLTVIANFVARALEPGEPPPWLTYSPLPPLFLLCAPVCHEMAWQFAYLTVVYGLLRSHAA